MKITGEMIHQAFEKAVGHPIEDRHIYSEVATILYPQLFPEAVTYTLHYGPDDESILAADPDELHSLISKHAVEGDYVTIYAHNEDNEDIGEGQFYYKQDGKFLDAIETYGAANGLEEALNQIEAQQAKETPTTTQVSAEVLEFPF